MTPGRWLKCATEAAGFYLAVGLLRLLTPDAASNLGGFLGRSIGPHLGISRRARRNLRLVFPEKSTAEIEAIVRGMWDNLGRVATEYPHLDRITAADSGRIELADIEPVRDARDAKAAAILVSAHLANWEVMSVAAARNDIDMTVIVREPNNPLVRPLLHRLRTIAGGGHAAKSASGTRQVMEVLRDGRCLGLLFDQKMNTGIAVPFFGVEAMTTAAPAQLALRFRCPLVPVRIERIGPARFRLSARPALRLPEGADRNAAAAQIMGELNRVLEEWIREKPEQWLWLHRRWPETAYGPDRRQSSG